MGTWRFSDGRGMTSSYEWVGFGLVLMAGTAFYSYLVGRPRFRPVARLVMLGFLLRVVGSLARYYVLYDFYGGVGDAGRYFAAGRNISRQIWAFDFSFINGMLSLGRPLRGTQFVEVFSGFVQSLIGPTIRGEFLFMALLGYGGLLLIAASFIEGQSLQQARAYLVWICVWPSLWFWPSTIGKEALILFATGLAVYGYSGRSGRMRWIPLALGLSLALAIRPHYALLIAVSLAAAYWLTIGRRWTPRTTLQAAASAVLAVWMLGQSLAQLGLADADLEGIREFVQYRADLTERGGSNIGSATGYGLFSTPMAFVNILFRPFLWEAHNALAAASALEIAAFWIVVWRRRLPLRIALRYWRSDRLLRLAIPLTLMYILMIGLTFGNLGIISRQRAIIFPFLFLLLEAVPRDYRSRAESRELGRGTRRPDRKEAFSRRQVPGLRGGGSTRPWTNP